MISFLESIQLSSYEIFICILIFEKVSLKEIANLLAVRNFYNGTSGTELMGKKLGIHAYGNVGRNVARVAKGFGMEVYAYDAFCPKEVIEKDGVKALDSAAELYKTVER